MTRRVPIHGAIFDLDGTLLDTMPAWATLGERYLRNLGFAPRPGLSDALRPLSLRQGAQFLRRGYRLALSEEDIIAGVKALIRHVYEAEALPKPGVAAFLRQLAARQVRMCIATATDAALTRAALTRCGLMPYVDGILTCDLVGAGKDDPAIYRAALAHLGTTRADTLVFEDGLHALRTAKGDGFRVVAVRDGSEPAQAEARALAEIYLPGFDGAEAARLLDTKEDGI